MGLATLSRMTAAAEAAQLGLAYRLLGMNEVVWTCPAFVER